MQLKTVILVMSFGVGLAACGVQEPDDAAQEAAPAACGAAGFQDAVGQTLATVPVPERLQVRIVEPATVVTTDFIATRMNIRVDRSGVITNIACG